MLKSTLLKSFLPARPLPINRFRYFSTQPSEPKSKAVEESSEFNTYKDFPQTLKENQLNPEQQTNWQRPDEQAHYRERRTIRLRRSENILVLIIVGAYYMMEDVFSYYGFKVYPPKKTFIDYWTEKDPEKPSDAKAAAEA